MKPLEIVIAISPADLAPWKGAEVPVRFVITESGITVHYPQPHLPPATLERLRLAFQDIAPSLSDQSREILWFLLNTDAGWATRQELMDNVWTQDIPQQSSVRKAVNRLRHSLIHLNFDCVVEGSRTGVFFLIMMPDKAASR